MIERHLAKLRARHPISRAEEQVIRGLISETRKVEAGKTVIHAGEKLNASTLLLDGIMSRFKDLRSGARQITELHVAGDFADMHSFTLKRLDHNIGSLTECTVGTVPHERIRRMVEAHPRLGRIYWFGTNLDAAIHREWEVSLGLRSASQRLAAFICEMHVRLGLVGLTSGASFALDLTQAEMAECMGITNVHANRSLKLLRELGLVTLRPRHVLILDQDGLRRHADYDPGYLYLDAEPL